MRRNSASPIELAVYPPREDSFLLLPFARVGAGTSIVEVGAGTGLASIAAARQGARVVATELNGTAIRRLRHEARVRGVAVEVVRTDLLRGLGRFDRILANPPYLPTRPAERDADPGTRLALDGGPDGCRVLARLVGQIPHHLLPGGSAFVVVSSLQDPSSRSEIFAGWDARGGVHEVVASRSLEGEDLAVMRLWRVGDLPQGTRRAARRTRGPRRGTGVRPRTPRTSRPGSSPGLARGRTTARDGASARTRCLPGS